MFHYCQILSHNNNWNSSSSKNNYDSRGRFYPSYKYNQLCLKTRNQHGRQTKTSQTLLQMSEANLGSSKLIGQSQIALTALSDVKFMKQNTACPRVHTVHSPLFFREIVEVQRVLTLTAAILIFKCTEGASVGDYTCSSRGRRASSQTASRPLTSFELIHTMAACNAQPSISTILRENREM